jgi:hypothetical protein
MLTAKGFKEKATPFTKQSHSSHPTAQVKENEVPMLTPRKFCRKMFGLFGLPEADILAEEMEYGYRRKCIRLLCQMIGVKRQTVLNWGGGLEFTGMPQSHQRILGLYWERYELLREVKRLRRFA